MQRNFRSSIRRKLIRQRRANVPRLVKMTKPTEQKDERLYA